MLVRLHSVSAALKAQPFACANHARHALAPLGENVDVPPGFANDDAMSAAHPAWVKGKVYVSQQPCAILHARAVTCV